MYLGIYEFTSTLQFFSEIIKKKKQISGQNTNVMMRKSCLPFDPITPDENVNFGRRSGNIT
jgi:hypothetical protein